MSQPALGTRLALGGLLPRSPTPGPGTLTRRRSGHQKYRELPRQHFTLTHVDLDPSLPLFSFWKGIPLQASPPWGPFLFNCDVLFRTRFCPERSLKCLGISRWHCLLPVRFMLSLFKSFICGIFRHFWTPGCLCTLARPPWRLVSPAWRGTNPDWTGHSHLMPVLP